jgi:hypothetical protein
VLQKPLHAYAGGAAVAGASPVATGAPVNAEAEA